VERPISVVKGYLMRESVIDVNRLVNGPQMKMDIKLRKFFEAPMYERLAWVI